MACSAVPDPVTTLLVTGVLVYAALHDFAVRTIPDRVTFCIALLGATMATGRDDLLISLSLALLVFVMLLAPWFAGLLGGGDVKLIPAITLLAPPPDVPALLCVVSIVGGVLAFVYGLLHRFAGVAPARTADRGRPWYFLSRVYRAERWRIQRRGPIPYAVAIAAGTLIHFRLG